MEIKHQTQILETGCGIACLSMLTNISQKDLLNICKHLAIDVEENGIANEDLLSISNYIFRTKEIWPYCVQAIPYLTNWLTWNRRFIVTVPSLNIQNGTHYVVLELIEPTTVENLYEHCRVFDPQKGISGKLYYENVKDIINILSHPVEIILHES